MFADIVVQLFALCSVVGVCFVLLVAWLNHRQNEDVEKHYAEPDWCPKEIRAAQVALRDNFVRIRDRVQGTVDSTVRTTVATLKERSEARHQRQARVQKNRASAI